MTITLAVVVKIPADGIVSFDEYENRVLPLLKNHGGTLQRRLRAQNHMTEFHILSFESQSSFNGFLADPEREKHRNLLIKSNAIIELFNVEDLI